jgi:hypothetical protein
MTLRCALVGLTALVAAVATGVAPRPALALASRTVPLPRPRPADLPGAKTQTSPSSGALAPAGKSQPPGAAIDQACLDRLAAQGLEIEATTPPAANRNECVIDTPVRLDAIKVTSRPQVVIRLPDRPTLSCRFVEQLGHWLADLVDPLVAGRVGSDIKAVRTGPGHQCRNRHGSGDGKLSAHATGIALDIVSFELANGASIPVKPNGNDRDLATMNALRAAACGWFTTVLGPGSDAAHAEHMHVDILPHGSSTNYRICQ